VNIVYGQITPSGGNEFFNLLVETMDVPLLPAAHGQELALWFGLSGSTTVVQVLLEYLPANGSQPASWYVVNEVATGTNDFTTQYQTAVAPGTTIQGFVQVDTGSTCTNYTLGQGCSWLCGFSINGGPWQISVFTPTLGYYRDGAAQIPAQEIFSTVTPGSLEMQTIPYYCDYLPNIPYFAWEVYGVAYGTTNAIYVPGPNWNQFQFFTPEFTTLTSHSADNCQEAAGAISTYYTVWWNASAHPGIAYED
jgi:hypothetical protein